MKIGVCERDGPEEVKFSSASGGSSATVNRGLYGVDLFYRFTLINQGSNMGEVYAYSETRGIPAGLGYFGAAHIKEPLGFSQRGVLPIKPPDLQTPGTELQWVGLSTTLQDQDTPILVAPGAHIPLLIGVANGGAATLPFNLVLTKLAFDRDE
ncbi:MAG: hypothetical protein ACR2HJ_03580 [Fimbriimonadales bacterium]